MSSSTSPVRRRTVPLFSAVVALVAGLLTIAPAASAADKDCPDFPSQRAAQLFFLRHGGPQSDPHRLDANSDGFACEDNGAPHYWKKVLPGKPKPKPKPKPIVIRTKATLAVNAVRRIAGEPVVLRGSVTPALRRPVVLQRKVGRAWKKIDTARTNRQGVFVHRTVASVADSRYRLVAPPKQVGRKRFTAGRSRAVLVNTIRQTVRLVLPASGIVGTEAAGRVIAAPTRLRRPFVVQRRQGTNWVQVATGSLAGRSTDVDVPLSGTTGTHRFRAVLRGFTGATAIASAARTVTVNEPPDTTPPGTPQNLRFVEGDTQVTVEWDAVSAPDLDHYLLQWSTANGGPWTDIEVTAASSTVTGLTNDTEYWFRVSAVDDSGNPSGFAGPQSATPAAPAGPPA